MPITLKVDVTKLDKSRFFHGKNGAVYCDLVLFEHAGEYDDGFVKQSQTREERERGEKMPIIGNFRLPKTQGSRSAPGKAPPARPQAPANDGDDDIPF